VKNGQALMCSLLLAMSSISVACTPCCAPIASAKPSESPTPSPASTSGGTVVILVPSPAPITCAPATISVPVAQTIVLNCTEQNYSGAFTWTLSNANIASVQLATGTFTYFYITGLKAGTVTLSLLSSIGGTGTVSVTVTTT
jgi:hypothetical protein